MAQETKIMIAEDDATIRSLLKASLNTQDYMIIEAIDGKDAVEKFSRDPCDAILMDINMPRMDGCQAIMQIRKTEAGKKIPIVVITALEDDDWFDKSMRAGANQFLTKPFRPKDVLHCLRTLLKDQEIRAPKNVVPKSEKIDLSVRYETDKGFMNCYLKNLMDGRSFVQSDKILTLGSTFNFEVTPPDESKPFTIQGTVKWVNLYPENKGMGISFAFANPEDEERVQQWVFEHNQA